MQFFRTIQVRDTKAYFVLLFIGTIYLCKYVDLITDREMKVTILLLFVCSQGGVYPSMHFGMYLGMGCGQRCALPPKMATNAVSTHPNGMHSCLKSSLHDC